MDMKGPLVSVIMPAYNSEKYIAEAIDSILGQTFQEFELIIIDDCCKDRTAEIVRGYQDDRIVFIQNEVNKGFLYGLNYGIEIARGKYIARLDDDDTSYPDRLQKQVDYLNEHEDIVLVGTRIDENRNGALCEQRVTPIRTSSQIRFELFYDNGSIAHSSFMMRKEVLEKNNIKYEIFKQVPDYHMLTCICQYGDLARLDETLVTWRIHPQQSTNVRSRRMKTDEFDKARCMYMETLALPEEYKLILKKAACRELDGKADYDLFHKAFKQYADMCKLDRKKKEDVLCCQFMLKEVVVDQRHNLSLLRYYLRNEYKDTKWLRTRLGVEFVIKCMIGYNKRWYQSTVDYTKPIGAGEQG